MRALRRASSGGTPTEAIPSHTPDPVRTMPSMRSASRRLSHAAFVGDTADRRGVRATAAGVSTGYRTSPRCGRSEEDMRAAGSHAPLRRSPRGRRRCTPARWHPATLAQLVHAVSEWVEVVESRRGSTGTRTCCGSTMPESPALSASPGQFVMTYIGERSDIGAQTDPLLGRAHSRSTACATARAGAELALLFDRRRTRHRLAIETRARRRRSVSSVRSVAATSLRRARVATC